MSDIVSDAPLEGGHLGDETALELEELREERFEAHAGHPSTREYVRIGVVLGVLTGLEVITYSYFKHHVVVLVPILGSLAFMKFALVALFFMHLKFDDRRLSRFFLMGIAGAFTLYIIVLLTMRTFLK